MANRCFVNSIAQVSCQKPLTDEWFDSPCFYEEAYVRAQEPDTKGLISPGEARRMSKILKRTVSTAVTALKQSSVGQPDAIITGTGMGCMENSEKFLIDICRFGENCLKPTLFMQSTHNTISSLIAIILKCHGYNSTYSHKGISFESALFDAWLQIKSGQINNALVGSHDEVTPFTSQVLAKIYPEYGRITEASVSCVLNNDENVDNLCEIADVKLFYRSDIVEIARYLNGDKDSLILFGTNCVEANDKYYEELVGKLNYTPHLLQYKNIFGDNFSSSAIAFYVGTTILRRGEIPMFLNFDNNVYKDRPKRITIINCSEGTAWSVIRLTK